MSVLSTSSYVLAVFGDKNRGLKLETLGVLFTVAADFAATSGFLGEEGSIYLTLFPVLAVLVPFNLARLASLRCITCDGADRFSISIKSSVRSMRNIRTRSARAGSCLAVFSKRPEGTLTGTADFGGDII